MFRGVAGRSPALGVGAYARSCKDARTHVGLYAIARLVTHLRVSQRAHSAAGGMPPKIPTYHTVCTAFFLKNLMVIIAQSGANGVDRKDRVYSLWNAQVVNHE